MNNEQRQQWLEYLKALKDYQHELLVWLLGQTAARDGDEGSNPPPPNPPLPPRPPGS